MGKKKDKQRIIQQARQQRKKDKEMKKKLRGKMGKKDLFKLSEQYTQYFKAFDQQIAHLKIRLRDVSGDGSCLFRAFADQLDGNQESHVIMRDNAVRYMIENQQFFKPFLDEDQDGTFEEYVKAMEKIGEWGGNLQLQSLAQCFRCIIIIHKKNLQELNVRPINEIPTRILHLGYFQHQDFEHYVSIRAINDQSQQPAITGLQNINNRMYNFLLHEDPEQFLLMQQLEEMDIYEGQQNMETVEQQQPYPNYPRNKKCKCGSKIDYKNCCFKDWQRRRQIKFNQH